MKGMTDKERIEELTQETKALRAAIEVLNADMVSRHEAMKCETLSALGDIISAEFGNE